MALWGARSSDIRHTPIVFALRYFTAKRFVLVVNGEHTMAAIGLPAFDCCNSTGFFTKLYKTYRNF